MSEWRRRIERRTATCCPPPSAGWPRSSCATPRPWPSAPSPGSPSGPTRAAPRSCGSPTRLGYAGFSGLQAAVRAELGAAAAPGGRAHPGRAPATTSWRARCGPSSTTSSARCEAVDRRRVRPGGRPAGRPPPARSRVLAGDAESRHRRHARRRPGPACATASSWSAGPTCAVARQLAALRGPARGGRRSTCAATSAGSSAVPRGRGGAAPHGGRGHRQPAVAAGRPAPRWPSRSPPRAPARSTATSAPSPSPTRWWPASPPACAAPPPTASTASRPPGAGARAPLVDG